MSLERALEFAGRGWLVLPLIPNGKAPLTSHGYKDGTADREALAAHWRRNPAANVGIVTGQASGIVVLDIDRKHGVDGVPAAAAMSLPPTFTVRTPSGGFHAYFRLASHQQIGRVIRAAPGLDVLGDGGYVVAPGSRVDGNEYRVVRDVGLVDCPLSLQRLATRQTPRPLRNGAPHEDSAGIPKGQRNARLASYAGGLRRLGMGGEEIADALQRVNERRCDPPLPLREVRAIAASIARYPAGSMSSYRNQQAASGRSMSDPRSEENR